MNLIDLPDEFPSVGQRALAVPLPPIVEKMYVCVLCKFVGDDDDDDDNDDDEVEGVGEGRSRRRTQRDRQ